MPCRGKDDGVHKLDVYNTQRGRDARSGLVEVGERGLLVVAVAVRGGFVIKWIGWMIINMRLHVVSAAAAPLPEAPRQPMTKCTLPL